MNIYVGNLYPGITEAELRQEFITFGEVASIALMNDESNGVVISSLYARDRMSIFAKPITGGKSEFELSSEEKDVLAKAIK